MEILNLRTNDHIVVLIVIFCKLAVDQSIRTGVMCSSHEEMFNPIQQWSVLE